MTDLRARAELVKADLDTSQPKAPTVGTPLVIAVEAQHPPGGVALLPEVLDLPDALGERRTARRHERRLEGEVEVDRYVLELIPFSAGILEIPAIELALGSTVAVTEPLLVTVESTLDESELEVASSTQAAALDALETMAAGDPRPETIMVPDVRLGLGLVGLLTFIILAVVSRKLWRRRQVGLLKPLPPPPPRPPHELALERLRALETSGLAERSEFNPYYTELSLVLRTYLGDRYGFDAVERTVDELNDALQAISTPGLDRVRLKALLTEADQIKFAKYRPRTDDVKASLTFARSIVESTQAASTTPISRSTGTTDAPQGGKP